MQTYVRVFLASLHPKPRRFLIHQLSRLQLQAPLLQPLTLALLLFQQALLLLILQRLLVGLLGRHQTPALPMLMKVVLCGGFVLEDVVVRVISLLPRLVLYFVADEVGGGRQVRVNGSRIGKGVQIAPVDVQPAAPGVTGQLLLQRGGDAARELEVAASEVVEAHDLQLLLGGRPILLFHLVLLPLKDLVPQHLVGPALVDASHLFLRQVLVLEHGFAPQLAQICGSVQVDARAEPGHARSASVHLWQLGVGAQGPGAPHRPGELGLLRLHVAPLLALGLLFQAPDLLLLLQLHLQLRDVARIHHL
mmetsp:Transcript_30708/g.57215  ORF Transcript_30708/g.57215 Transcript_30708/m.57215 type:complete len:306 (-) Transcript_30708:424-1341(-)